MFIYENINNNIKKNKYSSPETGNFILFWILAFTFFVIFVFRSVPLTADDQYYIDYFTGYRPIFLENISDLFDEPLFKIYTNLMSRMFSSEQNVRILIAIGILPHIIICSKLKLNRKYYYILSYFLFVELAPHLSFVQIRQGFAIGLYALIHFSSGAKMRVFGILMCGLIHTSLLLIAPFIAISLFSKKIGSLWIVIFGIVISIIYQYLDSATSLFGRREGVYSGAYATYSVLYIVYSVFLVIYVSVFFKNESKRTDMSTYQAMAIAVLPLFFMTTYGAFAERIYFFVKWFELSIVIQSRQKVPKFIFIGYFIINLSYTVFHSFRQEAGGGVAARYMSLVLGGS